MKDKAMMINDMINRSIQPIKCNKDCKHWVFDHLERQCVLSEVFGAMRRGCNCYDYELRKGLDKNKDL